MKLFRYLSLSLIIASWGSWAYAGAHPGKEVKLPIIAKNVQKGKIHIQENREKWFKEDLEWFTPIPTPKSPGEWEWLSFYQKEIEGVTLNVFQRSMGEEAPIAFFYFNGNEIPLSLDVAIDFLTSRIELSGNWTPVFKRGQWILDSSEGDQVWYQRYEPALVAPRNLVTSYTVKKLEEKDLPEAFRGQKAAIISMRSIPNEILPIKLPSTKKEPRITQRGAYFLVSAQAGKDESVKVYKIDSEKQGGNIPEFVTELAFPHFCEQEESGLLRFVKANRNEIIQNYNDRQI